MAELMLVANPRRRKRRRSRSRRSNPHRRSHARRRNPRRHRRHVARRRNPHRRRHVARYRRRNPSMGGFSVRSIMGQIKPTLKDGLVGATGALALDAVWGRVNPMLPPSISGSPYAQFAVKCLVAIVVGTVGGKLLRGKGRDLAVGGVTVAMHDMLKTTLQSNMPSVFGAGGALALSGYGGYGAYLSGSAPIVGTATFPRTYQTANPGFGAYLSGSSGGTDGAGVYVDDQMGFDPWEG